MANKLLHEQSLYLRQHAHNPVNWEPWGDAAFARAQKEDKPLIVSIGYAACHWCHVMERESFENEEVAAFMNEHFVCIKVDREEHPDVDQLYMDAVQAINGNGGWPLNVFVAPDRLPFYGGTYFPPRPVYGRPSWMQVLSRMNEIWTQQRTEVDAQSRQMFSYLQQASAIAMNAEPAAFDMTTCREIAEALLKQADTEEGGFGNVPKFPATMAISYLLEHYLYTSYEPALKQALLSLDKMIDGGIYDQLGGGFARYATDRNWLVPHFEKMLYDNALLVISLCDAFSITKDDKYRRVALKTLEFCERELKHDSGGYYCSLDADSEGEEGKFYTWTIAEWEALPAEDFDVVKSYYGVSEEGNWEGTNILHVSVPEDVLAARLDMSVSELKNKITEAKELLLNERSKRVRPATDDKCLLSWNALMNQALSKAAKTFGDTTLSLKAEEHMKWMLSSFRSGGDLLHSWRQGKAAIPAKLDDYAYLLKALLSLASVSGKNELIITAAELLEEVIAGFIHEKGSFFYYSSSAQTDIAVRKVDIYDGATPSANAVMAENLLWLAMCMERFDWQEQAEYMLRQMAKTTSRYAASFAHWSIVLQRYAQGLKTVVFTGEGNVPAAGEFMQLPIPHALPLTVKKEIFEVPLIADKKSASDLLIFVCTQQACLQPVRSIEETLHLTNR